MRSRRKIEIKKEQKKEREEERRGEERENLPGSNKLNMELGILALDGHGWRKKLFKI